MPRRKVRFVSCGTTTRHDHVAASDACTELLLAKASLSMLRRPSGKATEQYDKIAGFELKMNAHMGGGTQHFHVTFGKKLDGCRELCSKGVCAVRCQVQQTLRFACFTIVCCSELVQVIQLSGIEARVHCVACCTVLQSRVHTACQEGAE